MVSDMGILIKKCSIKLKIRHATNLNELYFTASSVTPNKDIFKEFCQQDVKLPSYI